MKYAVERDSGAMIHIPSLVKFGSGVQKEGDTQTHRQHEDRISLLYVERY
jgi:hypothetical protein